VHEECKIIEDNKMNASCISLYMNDLSLYHDIEYLYITNGIFILSVSLAVCFSPACIAHHCKQQTQNVRYCELGLFLS